MSDHNNNNDNISTSMGDRFKQRRLVAATVDNTSSIGNPKQDGRNNSSETNQSSDQKQQQQQQQSNPSGVSQDSSDKTFSTPNSTLNSRSGRGSGGRAFDERGRGSPRNGRGGGGRGGSDGSSKKQQPPLAVEQGVVCSLRDGFGFIHCADRLEQLFFHFSELKEGLTSSTIRMDDEVQFRIGESKLSSSSSSRKSGGNGGGGGEEIEKRIAAIYVTRVPAETPIVWEYPDETITCPVRGIIERVARNNTDIEGMIRIQSTSTSTSEEMVNDTTKNDGPLIRYLFDEYKAPKRNESSNTNTAPRSTGPSSTLSRGDIVELEHVVLDRRTKELYGKKITLIQSQRQRNYEAKEALLLESGTIEYGMITSVKNDFGFIKSNVRYDEIYFHCSNVLSNGQNFEKMDLKEGQEVKFIALNEVDNVDDYKGGGGGNSGGSERGGDGGGTTTTKTRKRVSARQVQLLPEGSVTFYDELAQGVTGIVVACPQPVDTTHTVETRGIIRLNKPIRMKPKNTFQEKNDEASSSNSVNVNLDSSVQDEYLMCTEVHLNVKDVPGGVYDLLGGSKGLYIQVGDTLLFDVIRDYMGVGGTCLAAPTKHLYPFDHHQNNQTLTPPQGNDNKVKKKIRFMELALAGRAEGTISTMNNSNGFIKYVERSLDIRFKMYAILPDDIQADLRRHMGLPEKLKVMNGVDVQFDLSVLDPSNQNSMNNNLSNKNKKQHQQQQQQQTMDRESFKARRILLLPSGSIRHSVSILKGLSGKVIQNDMVQPYVGTVEFDETLQLDSYQGRYPLLQKMIQLLLMDDPLQTKIVYTDIQSVKEEFVIKRLVDLLGHGTLKYYHIPVKGVKTYEGVLCIEKVNSEDHNVSGNDENKDLNDGSTIDEIDTSIVTSGSITTTTIQKENKGLIRSLKSMKFDKNSMSPEVLKDFPVTVSDVIKCDIALNRRTGLFCIENLEVTERHTATVTAVVPAVETFGFIKEMIPEHDFGFIASFDDMERIIEVLPFRISSVSPSSTSGGKQQIEKGDYVKFTVGSDSMNGKHVALNITMVDKKQKKMNPGGSGNKIGEENPCQGLVLMKLSRNYIHKYDSNGLSNTTTTTSSASSRRSKTPEPPQLIPEKKSRWDNVKVPKGGEESRIEGAEIGCILLTQDENGLFLQTKEPSDVETEGSRSSSLKQHLVFKKSNVSFQSPSNESSYPLRGDLVSFHKTRNGTGIREIRIIQRGAARIVTGTIESINKDNGKASFVFTSSESSFENTERIDFLLKDIMCCSDISEVRDKDPIEGIVYEGAVYGVCRVCDLYVEPKISNIKTVKPGTSTARQKLNLTVKKERGGTIMAQSMTAKGPAEEEGGGGLSKGFTPGWTKRLSAFAAEFKVPGT